MDLIDYEDKINAAMSMQQSRKCISIRPVRQTLMGMGHILNFKTSKGFKAQRLGLGFRHLVVPLRRRRLV